MTGARVLTMAPTQGFGADHRDIELLKLRNFTVGKKVPDNLFIAEDAQQQIADLVTAMVGFVSNPLALGDSTVLMGPSA